jgi:hypothetical protein
MCLAEAQAAALNQPHHARLVSLLRDVDHQRLTEQQFAASAGITTLDARRTLTAVCQRVERDWR